MSRQSSSGALQVRNRGERRCRPSALRRARPTLEQLECRIALSVGGGWINSTQSGNGVQPTSTGAVSLVVTGFPTTDTAGVASSFTVTAYDSYGNIATGYTGTVAFASADSQAGLPASYTFTTGTGEDNGVHTFSATLKTAGTQYLTATDTTTSSITGGETGIIVQPAAASSLAVTGLPGSMTSGVTSNVTVTAYDPYGNIATGYTGKVHFTSTDSSAVLPADYTFNSGNAGTQSFSATLNSTWSQTIVATDSVTSSITGSESTTVVPISASASFVKSDTTTQGNWIGAYGSDGYDLAGSSVSSPANATITPAGELVYPYSTPSPSTQQALQVPPAGTTRVAAVWYSATSFTVDVNVASGQAYNLELYMLDFDALGRAETVTLSNANTSAVLNTQSVSNFTSGEYIDWTISGNVLITFTRTAGANAVLSGLFFDPANLAPPPPPPPGSAMASFVGSNTSTEGNWIGVYGSDGYEIVGSSALSPAHATITPTGELNYTWGTPSPSTKQALAVPPSGTTRVAAVWYSATSFTVDVNVASGQEYNLELYMLDYDGKGRAQTVTLSNASTSAVLNTQSVSNFTNGEYLVWTISGNVQITFTRTAGANAVLNGLFLDPANLSPPPPGSATASFVGSNTSTEGNWIGVYGSGGYDLVGSSALSPAYATITPAGQQGYTWATPSPSTQQALEVPPSGTTRVAAVWYSATSFTVDVNVASGQAYNLELYMLDYDAKGRAETVTLSNAITSAVLNTQSVSNFTSGEYLNWTISGNVLITFTRTAGANAVLNGLFLDPAPQSAPSGPASALTVSAPTTETAGTPFSVTVTARQSNGNVAAAYTGMVAFASGDLLAGLPADYIFVPADNGIHTFSVVLKTAGIQYITATDIRTSSITGTQSGLLVQPAGAASLVVTGFPNPDTADVADSFAVTAYDPYGNLATGYTGTVAFSSGDTQAGLPASYKFTTGPGKDNGVHPFLATLETVGTQYLTATDTTKSSITGSETGIVVQTAGAGATSLTGQSGDGLFGQYYSNSTLSGTPAFTRSDDRIDFLWTDGNAGVPSKSGCQRAENCTGQYHSNSTCRAPPRSRPSKRKSIRSSERVNAGCPTRSNCCSTGRRGHRRTGRSATSPRPRRRPPRPVLQQFDLVGHTDVHALGRPGGLPLDGRERVSRRLGRPGVRIGRAERLVGKMDRYPDPQLQPDVHFCDQLRRQRRAAMGHSRRTAARQSAHQ